MQQLRTQQLRSTVQLQHYCVLLLRRITERQPPMRATARYPALYVDGVDARDRRQTPPRRRPRTIRTSDKDTLRPTEVQFRTPYIYVLRSRPSDAQ